jgi:hypothetical protein
MQAERGERGLCFVCGSIEGCVFFRSCDAPLDEFGPVFGEPKQFGPAVAGDEDGPGTARPSLQLCIDVFD